MIFAGPVPPNPSELVGNERFAQMIEETRNTFDMVIIDTPPIGSVVDAAVISKVCDGGILVIVLNKVDVSGSSYYGKYYGKYYGSYYGNSENNN